LNSIKLHSFCFAVLELASALWQRVLMAQLLRINTLVVLSPLVPLLFVWKRNSQWL
jgi:hypothetical protein